MAEQTSNAQNKMGELFIDIGSSGLGTLIKGLNSASASFLLAKKGAEELTKPLRETMKAAQNDATQWAKLSATLGGSTKQIQSLTRYFETRNLDSGLIEDIAKLQTTIYDVQHGFAAMPASMATAFNLMGMNIMDYDSSLEGTVRLIEDIRKKTKDLGYDAQTTQNRLKQMGISGEWAYAFNRPDFNLNDKQALDDDEVEKLIEASEAWNETKVATRQIKDKLSAKAAPIVTKAAKSINNAIDTTLEGKNPVSQKISSWADDQMKKKGNDFNKIIIKTFFKPVEKTEANKTTNSKKIDKKSDWSLIPKEVEQINTGQLKEIPKTDNYDEYKLPPLPKGLTGGAAPIQYSLPKSLDIEKILDNENNKNIPVPKLSDIEKTFKEKNTQDIKQEKQEENQNNIPYKNISIPALSDYNALDSLPSNVQKNIANDITVNNTNTYNISSTDPQGAANAIHQLDSESMSLIFQQATQQAYAL